MSASSGTSRRPEPVAITGLGVVSAAGRGVAAAEAALRAGRDGVGPLRRFASPRCGHLPVAEAPDAGAPRALGLAREALREAVHAAGIDASRAGIVVGTTVGGMPESEEAAARVIAGEAVDAAVWRAHECGSIAAALARSEGLRGPAATLSTACSSGAEAIAYAAQLLREGAADVMLAGGTDALCRLTLNGFASLLAVDPRGCRPFDRDREGMSLGEGAAFLVLERRPARARPLAWLAGSGNRCDAHHPTAPEPEGKGAEAAMRAALDAAGLQPADVDYVNAHGTGTPENDRAEGRALRRLFGAKGPPPVSSTKRVFGHALGAAGAIEAAVCVLALDRGFLPGTPGFAEPDEECELVPLATTRDATPEVALSNSFGFGGNNTVLCLRR